MNLTTLVVGLVSLILGGGGVGAAIPVFRYKADKSNVIAVGAESAVASLTAALAQSDHRVTQCEAENVQLRITLEEFKIKLEAAEVTVRQVSRDLASTKSTLDEILRGKT